MDIRNYCHFVPNMIFLFSVDNWAMIYAQRLAIAEKVPLIVCFCLVPKFLEATLRQYSFMLKGSQFFSLSRTICFLRDRKYMTCVYCCFRFGGGS